MSLAFVCILLISFSLYCNLLDIRVYRLLVNYLMIICVMNLDSDALFVVEMVLTYLGFSNYLNTIRSL